MEEQRTRVEREDRPTFHECWVAEPQQLYLLAELARSVCGVPGMAVEIGSWEGLSSCVIATALAPETLVCVDTWAGNVDEAKNHPSVVIASKRDVKAQFMTNMRHMTPGNFEAVQTRSMDFLLGSQSPIKFCYIDASHDYASVKAEIEAAMRRMVRGGVLCGDDYFSTMGRADLGGGVFRAVRELLPEHSRRNNLWWVYV